MPKYRVKELSLVGNELFQAGAIVDYDGLPAENLEPLCDEGRAKYQEYLTSNAERVKLMNEQNPASGVGDPEAFTAALAKSQAELAVTIGTSVAESVAAAFARLFPDGLPVAATKGGKASLV